MEPIVFTHKDTQYWMCPVFECACGYLMDLGQAMHRMFTSDDLPDMLKDSLSIVKTYAQVNQYTSSHWSTYLYPDISDEYLTIGWRAETKPKLFMQSSLPFTPRVSACKCPDINAYILVLDWSQLQQLKGSYGL